MRHLLLCLLTVLLVFGAAHAEAPEFSVPHGIYHQEFRLWITSPVEGATIYYTDDGSDPRTKGMLYGGSLGINGTSVIRAAFLLPDSTWSSVTTASYIFPNYIIILYF